MYTTERSREVAELFEKYKSVKLVAAELGLSTALISMYLPYGKTVYDLEEKSGNARRIARWREKKAVDGDHHRCPVFKTVDQQKLAADGNRQDGKNGTDGGLPASARGSGAEDTSEELYRSS